MVFNDLTHTKFSLIFSCIFFICSTSQASEKQKEDLTRQKMLQRQSQLITAIIQNKPQNVRALVSAGAEVNFQGCSQQNTYYLPLYILATTRGINHVALFDALASTKQLDIEQSQPCAEGQSETPIHTARKEEHWDLVKKLYAHGAEPACKTCRDSKPLVNCQETEPKEVLDSHKAELGALLAPHVPVTPLVLITLDYLFYPESTQQEDVEMYYC